MLFHQAIVHFDKARGPIVLAAPRHVLAAHLGNSLSKALKCKPLLPLVGLFISVVILIMAVVARHILRYICVSLCLPADCFMNDAMLTDDCPIGSNMLVQKWENFTATSDYVDASILEYCFHTGPEG